MSALARELDQLTLADIRNAVVSRALAGETVAALANEVADWSLDDDVTALMIRRGLIATFHDWLGLDRQPTADEAADRLGASEEGGGRLHPLRHYAKEHWQRVLAANYEGADGIRRAIRDFSLDDVRHVRDWASARAAGLLRLQSAMELADVLLARHSKERIAALPVKAQREIAEKLA